MRESNTAYASFGKISQITWSNVTFYASSITACKLSKLNEMLSKQNSTSGVYEWPLGRVVIIPNCARIRHLKQAGFMQTVRYYVLVYYFLSFLIQRDETSG